MNSLKNLSDTQLEINLKNLVSNERKLLHLILLHVKEVESRKLYLLRAYSSLYEYMTQALGYSGSAAMRRIEAARLLSEVPVLAEKIQAGTVNLSQVGELARAIKEKEKTQEARISSEVKTDLLLKIESTNAQTTQKILAQELCLEIKEYDRQRVQKDESVRLEVTLSKAQIEKLQACQDLLGHVLLQEYGQTGWSEVIECMSDQILRTKKIQANKFDDRVFATGAVLHSAKVLKSVTPKLRREIFHRDRCCQYLDPVTGKVCGSTFAWQVDHKQSQWAGGSHSPQNLQILCANHNRFKYQQESFLNCSS